ncbi:MAG: PDDEXK nuclease domain-containing protein [Planctomycetota bacterium]|jgi:predicted nuclease of restriction endonuclease-like (RecB) superfamily|nr:PDDEXK nuclease domain-containing protein [Planctomycetota bacterium]
MNATAKPETQFFAGVAELLQAARNNAYRAVNTVMVETYWQIGKRIVEEEQNGNDRANYGDYLVTNLSRYLTDTFGKGFSEANIRNFRRFFQVFPDFGQFATRRVANLSSPEFVTHRVANLSSPELPTRRLGNLAWSHLTRIMRLEDPKERDYYLQETAEQNWTVAVLERHIKTGYYRRLLSSPTADNSVPAMSDPTGFIKDPYVLEFLNVPEDLTGKETVLEAALIANLQKFLLELGKGFSFVARQLRVSTETDHFYVDLVFYNYLLKCFVIIDLKTAKLTPADIGQMDMYVRMFDELKRGEGDNPTIGIIMCADKAETLVKYSILKENRQIFAARYKTVLPTEDELAAMIAKENAKLLSEQGANSNVARNSLIAPSK